MRRFYSLLPLGLGIVFLIIVLALSCEKSVADLSAQKATVEDTHEMNHDNLSDNRDYSGKSVCE